MRKGFGIHDRHSPFRFNPATMFGGGAVKGAFYDPSNISTLFQDDAGTTPVTAVEQTVGRILDLSGNNNHATQSVAASRATYTARYNLATSTESFVVASWSRIRMTVSAGAISTPAAYAASSLLVPNTTNNSHSIIATASSMPAGARYRITLAFQSAGYSRIQLEDGSNGLFWTAFSTDAGGSVLTQNNCVSTITSIGGGWFLATITWNAAYGVSGTMQISVFPSSSAPAQFGGPSFAGDGTSGMYITGLDVRRLNDATTQPSYQRVTSSTNYDTNGFSLYLSFDGSNDSMLTGSIDFTGTDKMSVIAGVTKLSDAAQAVVAELSADIGANNGTFLLSAPNSAAANYNFSSKGTTVANNTVTTYTRPNTAVLTGLSNISGPSNIVRVNGAQIASVATTQGTGNFGNYPLYIGRRNNATLPFNGRLYGLIVLGAAASDWQVYVTEQWMAGKTGLQF